MDISRNLRKIRNSKSMSQKELAKKAGVAPSYIAFLETGDRKNPSIEVIEKIAVALEVTVIALLEDDQCVTTENK